MNKIGGRASRSALSRRKKEEGRRKKEEVTPPCPPPRGEIQESGRRLMQSAFRSSVFYV
jgi:hypothetical protein